MTQFAKCQNNFWTPINMESVVGAEDMFDEEGMFLQPEDRVV